MPPSTPKYLPNDLSEANFRRYESLLTIAVAAFPGETLLENTLNVSTATFIARMRSATLSLRRFSWPTTVDSAKLIAIAGTYTVVADATGVWFRVKHRAGRPSHLLNELPRTSAESSPHVLAPSLWTSYSIEEVRALCLLLHGGRLHGPILLAGRVDLSECAELELTYNVALAYDESKNQTVVL